MNRKWVLILVGAVLVSLSITVSAVLLFSSHPHAHNTPATPKDVITKTVAHPSTATPTSGTYKTTAGPNEPSYISLPTIGAAGYIQKVGVDQYSQMAAPNNVHLAGWYVNSLLPGQAGLSIIDGHVDGYMHNQGIFGQLSKLKPGDVFSVTFGNGSHKSFSVKSMQLVNATDVPNVLFAHDPGITSQLNLITCGGAYDGISHTYDKRTIVTSTLVN